MGIAIAALVVGICSILAAIIGGAIGIGNLIGSMIFLIIAVIGGIVGIILSSMTMKNNPEKKGFGIGGLVTSIIGVVYGTICLVACVACACVCGTAASTLDEAASNATKEISNEDKEKAQKSVEDALKGLGNIVNSTKDNKTNTEATPSQENQNAKTSGNSTDFRKWVDDYEKFMNEYCDFMEGYNPSDYIQLARYTQLLGEYSKWVADTEKLEEKDYSAEDWAYLLAAEARVAERVSKASGNMAGQLQQ